MTRRSLFSIFAASPAAAIPAPKPIAVETVPHDASCGIKCHLCGFEMMFHREDDTRQVFIACASESCPEFRRPSRAPQIALERIASAESLALVGKAYDQERERCLSFMRTKEQHLARLDRMLDMERSALGIMNKGAGL